MRPVRILFFSSSSISLPLFEVLASDSRFEVQGLFCQPDRPAGRGQALTPPPSKVLAERLGIKVYQPERLREAEGLLRELLAQERPDFLLTFAYGQILPQSWLDLALKAPLNVHGSLLPLYRGASPIQACLLAGDTVTGLSLMKMEKAMDAGPVAVQWSWPIPEEATADQVFEGLANLAAQRVPEGILNLMDNLAFEPQPEGASFCGKISKEEGFENFERSSEELLRRYRAYTSWPGLWTRLEGKRLKLLKLRAVKEAEAPAAKDLIAAQLACQGGRLFVKTSTDFIEILELQMEGKSAVSAGDFLRGHGTVLDGVRLG